MPEPGDAPGLTDIARRWAAHLACSDGVTLDTGSLEQVLLSVAREADARARTAGDAAARRFADLCSASPVGVVLGGPDGLIQDINPALAHLLEYPAGDLVGTPLSGLAATRADADALVAALDRLGLPGRRPRTERLNVVHAKYGSLRVRVTIAALTGDTEGSVHPVLLIEDINEVDLLGEALRKQNVQDSLTGLPNSYHFTDRLETVLGSGSSDPLALVYLDIDGFKVINDGLGPGAGDEVLRQVARKLETQFARSATYDAVVARLSGDGFAVLLQGEFTNTAVIDLVEDAMSELAEPVYVDGKGVGVNVSVGIVVTRAAAGYSSEELHRAAEITLHRAKENGKAQWMLFEKELHERDRRRYGIGAVIGGALENGEFGVDYEPTVKLDGSNEVAVVNAVLRWDHPEHGVLRPADFCSLADTTGMTPALGHLQLTQAMTDAAAWHREFAAAPDLCVRLPTRFAIDPNLVRMVRTQLRHTGLPPNALRICTDSTALSDPRGEVLETLSVLADLDVKITLAVSGAADLELVHTHHIPVGFVILTGPLIDALAEGGDAASGARRHLATLLERAGELGVKRIGADGVHTAEQARILADLGVVAGRGKLFGEEVDEAGIRAMLAEQSPTVRS